VPIGKETGNERRVEAKTLVFIGKFENFANKSGNGRRRDVWTERELRPGGENGIRAIDGLLVTAVI
jgi:hypothetical protein